MGVIAETDVDYGRNFGPFPAVGHIPPTHFIGYLTSDEKRVTCDYKVDLNVSNLGSMWMAYAQPARTVDEQNTEAYMKDGHIFYRTLRIIRANEEILVWYSKDLALILGINFNMHQQKPDGGTLQCPDCGEKFRFMYSLMAHIRFRCTCSTGLYSISPQSKTKTPVRISRASHLGQEGVRQKVTENVHANRRAKRKLDLEESFNKDHNELSINVTSFESFEENNNISIKQQDSPVSKDRTFSVDIGSAFRKVEKQSISGTSSVDERSKTRADIKVNYDDFETEMQKGQEHLVKHLYSKTIIPPNSIAGRFIGGLGMMTNWLVPKSSNVQSYLDPRLFEEEMHMFSVYKPELFQRFPTQMQPIRPNHINIFPNGEMHSKHVIMDKLRKLQLPSVQTTNPMVEKLLQTTTTPAMLQRPIQQLNLAQNWCAKCNATFRMTSDLVYHMRSHHKREFDPIKRKREEKLQCDVCKETFKERHHLTRHMTSHS
ncbi:histone-lysine N-methyltransferase PRDM9-like [Dreissena polymorpha]|uniref:histone-lysine N-methyltransferase PRDM9-like n=1 Tax=Dreissena polymorpha TaxID=45954 RepID=UPI002263DBE1|nr:histone-lysine N-methyltransferase PRDM9-like [Dreissena polymorpha]